MKAKDIMTAEVVTVDPEDGVSEIAKLMADHRISAVPVLDSSGTLVGMVSEGDLLRHSAHGARQSWWLRLLADKTRDFVHDYGTRAKDVMKAPVISVDDETDLSEIATLLESHGIKRVPVLRDGQLIGIVSRADILRGLAAAQPSLSGQISHNDRQTRDTIIDLIKRETNASLQAVSVVVVRGSVFLWGAVDSSEEKDAVRVAAENVAGVGNVHDFLSVLPEMFRDISSGHSHGRSPK